MPNLEAASAGFSPDPIGHVYALSSQGNKMIFQC